MKRTKDYVPQYSLSIKYVKMIMSRKEYDELLKKYVAIKVKNWIKLNK